MSWTVDVYIINSNGRSAVIRNEPHRKIFLFPVNGNLIFEDLTSSWGVYDAAAFFVNPEPILIFTNLSFWSLHEQRLLDFFFPFVVGREKGKNSCRSNGRLSPGACPAEPFFFPNRKYLLMSNCLLFPTDFLRHEIFQRYSCALIRRGRPRFPWIYRRNCESYSSLHRWW